MLTPNGLIKESDKEDLTSEEMRRLTLLKWGFGMFVILRVIQSAVTVAVSKNEKRGEMWI